MQNTNLKRIQRVSRFFQWLFLFLAGALPILYLFDWFFSNKLPAFPERLYVIMPALLPMSAFTLGMWFLSQLFAQYAQGKIFTADNVKHYRRVGYVLLIWGFVESLAEIISATLLALPHWPGGQQIVAGLELIDVSSFIAGGILVMLAWVTDEGRKLEDEQALTI